jgi:septal ring factor EnvC (AmiA/AmiB activator)
MGLLAYALVGIAFLGALGGLYYKVSSDGYDRGVASVQPKLDACQADIAKQNDALAALQAEQAKKQAAAAQALASATQKARVWQDNAAKLRAVLTAPRKAGEAAPVSCAAAWETIRGGK